VLHDASPPSRTTPTDEGRRALDTARVRYRGIIREAKPGLYWLDVVAYDIDLRQRFTRVRWVLLVMVVGLAVALGFATANR